SPRLPFLRVVLVCAEPRIGMACSTRPADKGIRIPRRRLSWAMASTRLGVVPPPIVPFCAHRSRIGHRSLHILRRLPGSRIPNRPGHRSASRPAAALSARAVTDYVYNYNTTASTVTATTHEPNLPNDPNRHWVRNTLDGLGRTIKVEAGE